ncbi:MAG: 16S rRNA (adenine(1518)-N(6)/adenine(1519)-N(6))-dimethyltransferase RsmA [Phycisphaerae bacterium]|jgi:16S rRNA (adenine1518-N6/adenine1519-N6)-dimethyltransferase
MQALHQIRQLLTQHELAPQKQYGQCFLIDLNLMGKLLELADVRGDSNVLEVGPGTGSLTEELLSRAGKVVAVEIDRGLHRLLSETLGDRPGLSLIHGDVLAGKHAISPEVVAALGTGPAQLVSNLPYSIATPLIAQCLIDTWGALRKGGVRFERLTFTVQREVCDRLAASVDSADYGPVSILVTLLGKMRLGPVLPREAFWPSPSVTSRMARIDIDPDLAGKVDDVDALVGVLSAAFGQRRKQLGAIARREESPFPPGVFSQALATVGIDPQLRAQAVTPEQFRLLANALAKTVI